jgi:hypothetical protein
VNVGAACKAAPYRQGEVWVYSEESEDGSRTTGDGETEIGTGHRIPT